MTKISHDSETPAPGQQVITACAFIHLKIDGVEKVFLPKRAMTKKFLPDVYELPGGHIDFGEDPVTGLKREIEEELNMQIDVGDPFYVFTYSNPIKGSHSIEVVYFARFTNDLSQLTLNQEDHSEYSWFSVDDLNTMSGPKGQEDIEIQAILMGFDLLAGSSLKF